MFQVILIFGIVGVCRGNELTSLTVGNVKDDGNEISIHIPETKTKVIKEYIIAAEMAKIIRKYTKLRPVNAKTDRLFVQYRHGKCVNQVIGKHTIAKVPKEIATFLKLPDPKLYTGHSFRHTGTTIAADAGAGMEDLMRLGEQYIRKSKTNMRKLGNLVSGAINLPKSSSAKTNSANSSPATEHPVRTLSASTSNNENGSEMGVYLSSEQMGPDDNSNGIILGDETTTSLKKNEAFEMASNAVNLLSDGGPLSEKLKGLAVQTGRGKETTFWS